MFLLIELLRLPEQIIKVLVVHFNEGTLHAVFPALLLEGLGGLVDLANGEGDHAVVAGHGVCLAGARLAVAEDADVVAVEGGLDELGDFFEDVSVLGGGVEDAVKVEWMGLGCDCAQA